MLIGHYQTKRGRRISILFSTRKRIKGLTQDEFDELVFEINKRHRIQQETGA